MGSKARQPVLKIPESMAERMWTHAATLGVVLTAVMAISFWANLPAQIPAHFDLAGRPDAWSGKWILALVAVMSAVTYAAVGLACRAPHRFSYLVAITPENAERQYRFARLLMRVIEVEAVWLMTYLQWQTIHVALGRSFGLGIWWFPAVIAIFAATALWGIGRARALR
ncbi:MAG TPA: hypothetical protein DDX89_03720 [Candidatus Omnitrophica bacterium]|nr:MAG: hypothetical protein A2Z92_03485 [Omnitrophica WOR_2 bacterium GWA2_63_20]OGX17839.1 MAG: hypothetical protein A2105_05015 [Omnitrophica WOR_2 bacterium GWF2_63_9]OGX35293.1 MAG: hypothetical protein A3B73_00365 [Omnitrophica WOR_2 bacterium RIFCSPHIGHO2_02_FULL_63_39]OGX44950.1 MAG: hypothetical protein A3I71_05385 [Omnitrophica WOR_2 bacterium RIFCSPLOWO2_02_FULL_63_16]OGX49359.1 MAG: hypothetical protein A3G88_00775 [Omnitrophica WOR_2 bacterium RIFCSPLOWO2_12_FULL_63_16]HAM40935.1 